MITLSSPFRSFLRIASLSLLCIWYLTHYGRSLFDTLFSYGAYPFYRLSSHITQLSTAYYARRQSYEELLAAFTAAQRTCDTLRAEVVSLRSQALFADLTAPLRDLYERYMAQGALVAQILSCHCSAQEQSMVVDVGSQQGVRPDMIAVAAHGIVGRVAEVFPWYSRVILMTDRRCKIPVICAQTKTNAIYEGCNQGGEGRLLFVSCLQELVSGDLLLTSGKGLIYPAGFAVGTVGEVTQDAQGLYYTATVISYGDPTTLSHCLLLNKGASTEGHSEAC